MSDHVCLDSSVLIKVLTLEEESELAAQLLERIFENNQVVVLPSVAWAEIGNVLRQKVARKEINSYEAEAAGVSAWQKIYRLSTMLPTWQCQS